MGLVHLFHMHWPHNKFKILLNYVNCITFRFIKHTISQIEVIHEDIINCLLSSLVKTKVILDYSSLFSNTYCPDNFDNVREGSRESNTNFKK